MKKLLCLMVVLLLSAPAYAADFFSDFRFKGVNPMTNGLYNEGCAECHYGYQPGLLPARSWEKMMLPDELEDHFGENAELDEEDRLEIRDFLVTNAADSSLYKRSRKIMRSLADEKIELRISEVPYIKRKHKTLQDKHVKFNPKVKSIINCNACHRGIDKGIFDDDTILIPN
ncbi:MAG: diheme cytochrome c, partial [Mariprofundaceae bacterium]|nr:diheme cytochrome c [Mariprofundaceae bacterium]